MPLFCPVCMGSLDTSDGHIARCSTHGGEFTILFLRDSPANPPPLSAVGTPIESAATVAASGVAMTSAAPAAATMRCVQHPGVPATAQCTSCGAYMCATCDFALPGEIHLCPACATKPVTKLSAKRRTAMIWSYVCAAGATIGFVVTMIAAVNLARQHKQVEQQTLGVAMMLVVFVPAAVGIGVGLGAIDRRLVNPLSLKIATVWNGLILGAFLLLSIVGAMS